MSKLQRALKGKSPLAQEIITGIAELLDIKELPKVEVTPQKIISKLKHLDGVNLTTYEQDSFDELTRLISKIKPRVTIQDLEKLHYWLDSEGLLWWRSNNIKVNWRHICKHFVAWLSKARDCEMQQYESVIR